MKLTEKQSALIKSLMDPASTITVKDAIKDSGFASLMIATFLGLPWSELMKMEKANVKVVDLPEPWKAALRKKAAEYKIH